ncbi:centrosome and spindle pole-associated protein 1 isoform X3 [Ascaphus truei]|uniref:centrosome and spindle pole-associated protein 1 isoform X3 n=1 Tax=Ascaphus truei TaxID=8439 RepID=UPI003F5A83A7
MGEDLDRFIEEQKAKLTQDKADLEKEPPYMEIRSKGSETALNADKLRTSAAMDNLLPNRSSQKETAQMQQIGDMGYGLSLPLGEDYERKKHKLKEELRQDYRRYLTQKHLRTTGEVDHTTQGMSLPIGERLSAKERLRIERNKEYNQFLRIKEDDHERFRLLAAAAQQTQTDKPVAASRVKTEEDPLIQMSYRDPDPPRRDAYASMEAYEQLLNKRRSEENRYRRQEGETETQDRLSRRAEEDLSLIKRKYGKSDMDTDMLDRPLHIAADWEFDRKPKRLDLAPDTSDDIHSRLRCEVDARERRPKRYSHLPERMMPRRSDDVDNHDYYPEEASYFQIQKREHRPRMENPALSTERSKSANKKEEIFSTGLLLGGSDREDAQQKRKERYRQDLMEQMAEQQRNKRREKELELKVAASGAIDPEKQPDRLRQFGAVNRRQEVPDGNVPYRPGVPFGPEKAGRRSDPRHAFEEMAPPERPRVAFQTPDPEAGVIGSNLAGVINPANEEYHRGLSNALGEIVAPRIAAVPPPQPPVLAENYRTPYDDAYYFYGARNPLDPSLAYYPRGMLGLQPAPVVTIPVTDRQHNQPEDQPFHINRQRAGDGQGASLGLFPEEKPRQSKQKAHSYQEDLEQQILERNARRRKEKEEREQYDAKLEADMRSYNPWGKGGGGAPLRDSRGNLITDLKRMHKLNEDAYQNPETKAYQDRRAAVAVDLSLADTAASTSKIPGISFASSSPFARGNVFVEPPTEQQVQQQESYKHFLRLQIDEKRRKEEEERDRLRLEEEKEEKRVAEQRAKIQWEYEEEQNKKKSKDEEQRLKNEELVRLAGEKRKEAERKLKDEEEKQEEELRRYYDQENATSVIEVQAKPSRQPSPLIPTLQHKRSSRAQRPPTAESRVSEQSNDRPQSRAVSPPVPARRNQLRADDKKSVISELSELRKQLRSEQRRLEGRLLDVDRDDESSAASMSGRRREKNPVDVFDMARQRLQATVRRPSLKGPDPINMQNIREFNDLKYRDTDTREGVRHMYPDPPKDDQTLEIQQQALLREQQRNLNRMKKRPGMPDDFEAAPAYTLRHTGMFRDHSNDLMKTSLLESESAFIGENGEPFPPFMEQPPDFQPSARERRRHKKALDFDNDIPHVPAIPFHQPDRFSVHSDSSLNVDELQTRNEQRLRRLSNLQKSSLSMDDYPDTLGDAEDILKLFPTKAGDRPYSVDTVATDPWLRPGTSETLKRFMAGQMTQDKPTNENVLTFNWQGLSTAHG